MIRSSVPLSIKAKFPFAIQMDSDQHLNDFAAVNFRQVIDVAKGSWGLSVTLALVFSSVSVFGQLSVKALFQIANVIRKEAIWRTIDEYLMMASSRLKEDMVQWRVCEVLFL
jgi:hypothetical protein